MIFVFNEFYVYLDFLEGPQMMAIHESLEITPQTVWAYIKQGRLRGKRNGRPISITERAVREFIVGLTGEVRK